MEKNPDPVVHLVELARIAAEEMMRRREAGKPLGAWPEVLRSDLEHLQMLVDSGEYPQPDDFMLETKIMLLRGQLRAATDYNQLPRSKSE